MTTVRLASGAADPARPNEDCAVAMAGLIAVFDGVSIVDGIESGCCHGPAWYSSRLAASLGASYTASPQAALSDTLAQAIERVCAEHGGTCDLRHPGTPQSTVAMLRLGDRRCDYLVLSDSTLVLDCSGTITTVTDNRVRDVAQSQRRLALSGAGSIGSPARIDHLRELTLAKQRHVNQDGGYWIASADPNAARHAVQGSVPRTGPRRLTRAAALTDGASCVVDQYGLTDWRGLLDLAHGRGPEHVVSLARTFEGSDPGGLRRPRPKTHDDATVVYRVLDPEVHP